MATADVPLVSSYTQPADPSAGASAAAVGGLGGVSAATGMPVTPEVSAMQFAPGANLRLGRNPMLPMHPTDAALDSQYMAQEAMLRAQVSKQYADVLQQLGYSDDQGNFIPGSVETNAALAQNELSRSSDLAGEDVTRQHQQQGTLFSGLRGTDQARAQHPFQQQIAQLGIDTPLQLGHLFEQASGLMDDYTLQNNQLLVSAAQRRAAALAAAGGGIGGTSLPGAPPPPPGTIGNLTGDNPVSNPSLALTPRVSAPASGAQPALGNGVGSLSGADVNWLLSQAQPSSIYGLNTNPTGTTDVGGARYTTGGRDIFQEGQ